MQQIILRLKGRTKIDPDELPYEYKVNTARSYLRRRDFLTYATQLIPERIGSESWALAWGYIREVDDIIDQPNISLNRRLQLLNQEKEVILASFNNEFVFRDGYPIRYLWLNQFLENEEKYYNGEVKPYIWELYESAKMDVKRRGILLRRSEMNQLLYKKAGIFFKMYFKLSGFDLGPYFDEICELLGIGLGILDDMLDMLFDYRSGYYNVTIDELKELGIDGLDPSDKEFVFKLVQRGYFKYKSVEIMKMFIKAREIARQMENKILRRFLLRLTEIFAAPIVEGRFLPGQKYLFKGGKLLNAILPKNETIAYKIGHKLVHWAMIFPQVAPNLFDSFMKKVRQFNNDFTKL